MTRARVRSAEQDDVATMVDILIAGSLTPESESRDQLDAYWLAIQGVRATGGDVFVATLDEEVIGVCQVVLFPTIGHSGGLVAEIENVHIRETHRNGGIGQLLIETCEQFARGHDCYRVQLTSNVVRTDAHRFYGRLGYQVSHVGFKKSLDH